MGWMWLAQGSARGGSLAGGDGMVRGQRAASGQDRKGMLRSSVAAQKLPRDTWGAS